LFFTKILLENSTHALLVEIFFFKIMTRDAHLQSSPESWRNCSREYELQTLPLHEQYREVISHPPTSDSLRKTNKQKNKNKNEKPGLPLT